MSSSGSPVEMVVLASSAIELTVLPQRGARLHRLRAFGRDVLRTPPHPVEHGRDPFYWGGYIMAPWCNRLAAEPTQVAGRTVDLAPNFRDGTAIHGQVYLRPWRQLGEGEFQVDGGGAGWPWPYRVHLGLEVSGPTLTAELRLTNLADEAMPAGVGLHPWFLLPLELSVKANSVFTSNLDSAPKLEPVAGAHDLRRMGTITPDLDATWAGVSRPPVEFLWPTYGLAGRLDAESSSASLFITAASPSNVEAVAVEPQTHAPQGLRRLLEGQPGALFLLPAAETLRLTSRLTFSQSSGDNPA